MPDGSKTVHVPILGNQPKGAVLAGGAAVVAVGGYLAWKHFTGGSSSSAGTYGYGQGAYGYGSSSPYGYGTYAYGAYSPYGYSGYYGYGYGYNYGYGNQGGFGYGIGGGGSGQFFYGYGGGGSGGGPTTITTNAQWTQAALPALKNAGFQEMTAIVALGRYLAGKEVSQDQARVVEAAIALEGDPPQSGANGYPPKVKIGPHKGHKPPPKHHHKPTHYIITNGQEDMHQIAVKYKVTTDELVGWNPSLKRYVGTGKKVPKGKRIKV